MSKIAKIKLSGASSQSYDFGVFAFDHKFPPLAGVYYISERSMTESDKGTHVSLYIGQSGDISRCFEDREQIYCFTANGANCICLHLDPDEQSRLHKVWDLVNALQPLCNE